MANTSISEVSTAIVRKGQPITKWAGLAASTYIPGDWVYYSATSTATAIATGTAACKLVKPMPLDFEPRLSTSDKARKDIDDAIATDVAAVILGGLNGPLEIAATHEDPGGALLKGNLMMASNTAGDIEQLNSGTDPTAAITGQIIVHVDQANGDTVGIFLYY